MSIYEQTYRGYEGRQRLTFRWYTIIRQELRILVTWRPFLALLFWALILFVLRLLQIVAFDSLRSTNREIAMMMNQVAFMAVNEKMFFDFLRSEGPIMFLIMMFAGSGMICDDFRNNLMEIYFSKPLGWVDYVLGKVLTLLFLGVCVTAGPGLFLLLLHNLLVPGIKTLRETAWLVGPIIGFSLLMVVPAAFGVLASSAVSRGQRHAATAIFILLAGDISIPQVLSATLHNTNYLVLSLPIALNRVGESLFMQRRHVFELGWEWGLVFVGIFVVVCTWLICVRVRHAEFAS